MGTRPGAVRDPGIDPLLNDLCAGRQHARAAGASGALRHVLADLAADGDQEGHEVVHLILESNVQGSHVIVVLGVDAGSKDDEGLCAELVVVLCVWEIKNLVKKGFKKMKEHVGMESQKK